MTIKERYEGIIGWFSENMPEPETELHYDSPFHLLLAVILGAMHRQAGEYGYTRAL